MIIMYYCLLIKLVVAFNLFILSGALQYDFNSLSHT